MRIQRNTVQVTTEIPGDTQEMEFMNATLQRHGDFEFSIAAYLDLDNKSAFEGRESELAEAITKVLEAAANAANQIPGYTLGFEVQIGPEGTGDDEDDED